MREDIDVSEMLFDTFVHTFIDHLDPDQRQQAEGDPVGIVFDPAHNALSTLIANEGYWRLEDAEENASLHPKAADIAFGAKTNGYSKCIHAQGCRQKDHFKHMVRMPPVLQVIWN